MEHTDNGQLKELVGSNYEIIEGEANIIGWIVQDSQGSKIGEVDDLLFSPETNKVRYLIVDFEDNNLDLEEERKVLVPIGIAELHERDDQVVLPQVTTEQLSKLPPYEKDKLTPETESTIRSIFEGTGAAGLAAAAYNKDDFYNHEHFNEDRFYNSRPTSGTGTDKVQVIEENLQVGKQEVETGGARLTSRLVERPVEEHINLREEHVSVERTTVNRPVSAADLNAFEEKELELTEHAEVPVIAKEARVVEEVSLTKEVSEHEETIKDTVRSTEVEAERINPDPKDQS